MVLGSTRVSNSTPVAINASINGVTTNLSWRGLRGTGGGLASDGGTNVNMSYGLVSPGSAAVSNTFSNFRILIPYYTLDSSKPMYFSGGGEDNSGSTFTAYQGLVSWNTNDVTAITSLAITTGSTTFVANTSISLYIIS